MKKALCVALFLFVSFMAICAFAEPLLELSDGNKKAILTGYDIYTKEEENYLILYGEFTCDSSKAASFGYSFQFDVFQNGIECENGYIHAPELGKSNSDKKVKNGATIPVYAVKRLNDISTDIEVELKPWLSFKNNETSGIFPIKKDIYESEEINLTLQLSPDVWDKVMNNADEEGLSISEYLSNLVTDAVKRSSNTPEADGWKEFLWSD